MRRKNKRRENHLFPKPIVSHFEDQVADALDSLGIEYKRQYKLQKPVQTWIEHCYRSFHVDFFLPQTGIILEVNGCCYHGCVSCGYENTDAIARQAYRLNILALWGYKVLILWGHDTQHKTIQEALQQLLAS